MNIVILGLSITSSWGNGHATTYRALLREMHSRGHEVTFLECNKPWYAEHRDLPTPDYCGVGLYNDLAELKAKFGPVVRHADALIVGSFVPNGVEVAEWALRNTDGITAFYDIDTPVTLEALGHGSCEYLVPKLIPRFDIYLSFTGGPVLRMLERRYGARFAAPLHCSVDTSAYQPMAMSRRWDLGYLGTFSADRQPALQELLIEPASTAPLSRMVVAGPLYPKTVEWPANVQRIDHLAPHEHASFYNAQRFTLNLTRAAMVRAGFSPSVRLFEAAACGTPIISDQWDGLETFFEPGREILTVKNSWEVLDILTNLKEADREAIGRRARSRVLREHSAAHRAFELENLIVTAQSGGASSLRKEVAA